MQTGHDSHGRQYANSRLWPRLDGKVPLEEFIAALRHINNNELADRIEGMVFTSMMPIYIWVFYFFVFIFVILSKCEQMWFVKLNHILC